MVHFTCINCGEVAELGDVEGEGKAAFPCAKCKGMMMRKRYLRGD